MDKRQEKAKELYRNKKTDLSVCEAAKLHKQINPFFIFAAWRESQNSISAG